jgi:response regulator RpfG family c-di-GMP phosphodiesterase
MEGIMNKLLLVDDEPNVLHSLRRELRDQFELETFDNPVAALEHCRKTQFDLVIADYRMPQMDGLEFLKRFGQLQPDASRLLLSGEVDSEALIRLINETHIFRFIAKPWDRAQLVSFIQQSLAFRDAILQYRNRDKTAAAQPPRRGAPFRIVLVEKDERLRSVMARGLTEEGGQANLFSAIMQEIRQEAIRQNFKCTVDGFRSAHDALKHIAAQPCDLVISSQNLPDMDGIDFLARMRNIAPDTARILLGEAMDKSKLSRVINEAAVHALLQLEWENYEMRADVRRQAWNLHQLKTAVIQALAYRELLPSKSETAA